MSKTRISEYENWPMGRNTRKPSLTILDNPAKLYGATRRCAGSVLVVARIDLTCFYGASGGTWRRFDSQSVGNDGRCRLAYRDQTWVVRLAGPHSQPGQPASSSIRPSLAARMLHELAVTENDHILEIGTGTGYLTALLCHRLGASNITSTDIDADLVDSAGRILAELGYTPTLATADGTHGYPDRAPYDRVLGTAAVEKVPQSWIDQTRPGGRIVTPLRSAIAVIHEIWHTAGDPRPDRYQLTINPQGHTISLDDRHSPHSWKL
ncbi:MAG: methyltransferase domain-containing protein [Pseudonocardiaceae bacterium]